MVSTVSTWAKQRRVAAGGEIADAYFRLAIPDGSIGHAEMKATLALASNPDAFGAKLVDLSRQLRPDGRTRLRALLDRLEDYTEQEIPAEHIAPVVQALFRVGDKLLRPEDEPRNILDFGNELRIGRIIRQLLRRLEEPERFGILRGAISASDSLTTIVREVGILEQGHKRQPKWSEDQRIVNAEHLGVLRDLALEKIRAAVANNTLLRSKNLANVLFRWWDWAGPEEAQQWVVEIARTDSGLAELLERLLGTAFSTATGAYDRLEPDLVSYFLNVSEIADRARRLAESGALTERRQTAVNEFIRVYDRIQEGKDPDAFPGPGHPPDIE